jgi:hypothetical protein
VEPLGSDPGQTGLFFVSGYPATGSTNDVTVYYRVSGTASASVDYTNLSGVVTITNNGSGNGTTEIDVHPIADNFLEGSETVILTLIPTNRYLIYPNQDSATNFVQDSSITVWIESDAPFNEAIEPDGPPGAPAVLGRFTLSRYDFRFLLPALTVKYLVSGTANNGADYTSLTNTVTFAPGEQATNILVMPLSDGVVEGLETVIVTLVPTNTYLLDDRSNATVSILDSTTKLSISAGSAAVEPNATTTNLTGQAGYFQVSRDDDRNFFTNLTVYYRISGTASNGVDHTNLTGSIRFANTDRTTNIYFQPLADYLIEGDETVILTLLTTNGYYVNADYFSATNVIQDTIGFVPAATVNQPIGIDYHAPSNSLIVSSLGGGFLHVYTNPVVTNGIVITNWSGIAGFSDEVKLATVKTNASGFTDGDLYFSSNTGIGRLSADGSVSNLNWCILTNSTVTNALQIRGSLYVDRTGLFSNQVIAVTSSGGGGGSVGSKGVWRVDAQAHPTLIASINTSHLEGVITLPNNTNTWGPWAGKIITGDEENVPPLIYTIATNGTVMPYDTTVFSPEGIEPEDFDIIPTNQNLYACDFGQNAIMKLSAKYFANLVGDLLITQAGEGDFGARLFIVHWDNATSSFVTLVVPYSGKFEHVSFAPIEIPPH